MQKHVFMFRNDTAVEYAYITYDDTLSDANGRNEQVDNQVKWVLNAVQSAGESVYEGANCLTPLGNNYVRKGGSSANYTIARKRNIGHITLIEFDTDLNANGKLRINNVSCYPNEGRKWQRELAQSAKDGRFAIDDMVRVI